MVEADPDLIHQVVYNLIENAFKFVNEGGYIEVDKNNLPEGDSAWFNIYADDIDSLEKLYFVYKFRYSPNL